MKIFSRGVAAAVMLVSLTISGVSAGAGHPATEYVEGDVIVTFKPSVSPPAAEQVLTGHSLAFQKHFAELSRYRGKETGLVHARNRTTAELIAELSRDPTVEAAEPNYLRWVTSETPNDPYFTNLWALQNTGQAINGTTGTAGDDIHFVAAWALAQPPPHQPAGGGGH
jgi:hypothetical protein